MKYWNKEFQTFLLGRFVYDKSTGQVKRKSWPLKGPKTPSPLGTRTRTDDYVLTFEDHTKKIVTIRLVKLAVFLETGKQYARYIYVDGNKLNTKWDNIAVFGEIEDVESFISGRKLSAQELHEAHQREKQEAIRLAAIETAQIKGDRVARVIPRTADDDKFDADGVFRYERGLFTGGTEHDMRLFLIDCNKFSGIEITDPSGSAKATMAVPGVDDLLKTLPKWKQDRCWSYLWLYRVETGDLRMKDVERFLHEYKFEGQPVVGQYKVLVQPAPAASLT